MVYFRINHIHRINHIRERALRIAYKDYQTDVESLLEQRNLVSILVKNLQFIMTKSYKTKFGLISHFMKDIFVERNTGYDLRHSNDSQLPKVHTTTYGIETVLYTLQNTVKQACTFLIFKSHIKCWKGENCNCRLCKTCIPQAGYLT